MKFTLLFFAVAVTVAAAQSPRSDVSEEGIFKDLGNIVKGGLKDVTTQVGKHLFHKVKDLLTDKLHLQLSKEALLAVQASPSQEGIFSTAAKYIWKHAKKLAEEYAKDKGPSHEGIIANFGVYHKIYEAEQAFNVKYNKSVGPSHEGLFDFSLGGIIFNGLGDAIGGDVGNAIKSAGNVVGNLVFTALSPFSAESIQSQQPSQEGIISSVGRFVGQGIGHLAGELIKGVFPVYNKILGNVFLARGVFNRYSNIQAPANEIIFDAKNSIKDKYPNAGACLEVAEHSFAQLLQYYNQNGQQCVEEGEKPGKEVVEQAYNVILAAVQKVEDVHREVGECFDKESFADKNVCLGQKFPQQVQQHKLDIAEYNRQLAQYVKEFTNINTDFDICLVQNLGEVRREVYHIVEEFHSCVSQLEQPHN